MMSPQKSPTDEQHNITATPTTSHRNNNMSAQGNNPKDVVSSSSSSSSSFSPVGVVDPVVRAMNTVMYGLLVHFGTLWTILHGDDVNHHQDNSTIIITNSLQEEQEEQEEQWSQQQSSSSSSSFWCSSCCCCYWLQILLLLHGYWVYLQHANVLANPFCQRLDRQYGIALLKSNQHWAIAGTLSAYWCRETLGMFLCLPFLLAATPGKEGSSSSSSSTTHYWILYSLIYHTIKSRGVRQDALRRYSPSYGIMRVVIDKFYLHTTPETILSMVRISLQGLDTWIHYSILRDLLLTTIQHQASMTTSLPLLVVGLPRNNNDNNNNYNSLILLLWMLHAVFGLWVVHAALNQYFRCSTASVMVQAWYSLTAPRRQRQEEQEQEHQSKRTTSTVNDGTTNTLLTDDLNPGTSSPSKETDEHEKVDNDNDNNDDDDETEVESVSSTETEDNDDSSNKNNNHDSAAAADSGANDDLFIVRKLLRPGRVPEELQGRQGAVTDGVDTAVRIETVLAILASTFLLGLGTVPFRALTIMTTTTTTMSLERTCSPDWTQQYLAMISFAWWLSGLLYGIWALFLKTSTSSTTSKRQEANVSSMDASLSSTRSRQRTMVNIVDLMLLIATATQVFAKEDGRICWYLAVGVTVKSYLQASRIPRPYLVWTSMRVSEFVGKLILLRRLLQFLETSSSNEMAWIELTIALAWAIWVVSTPIPTPCELESLTASCTTTGSDNHSVADVVFLGHPAELIDCWALWLLPYSLHERWQGPWWAIPLWPLHYLVGWYVCNYRRKLFGDKASFFCCDNVSYDGIQMQTWTASHFGRHFVTHPFQVKQNIEAAARHAERTGVKVLCLGALNKAESINSGGVGVVKALDTESKLSVIHGNHLTAAAVGETTLQCFGEKAKVFLTGASSKVGWAVAQALRDRHGFEVLCHSTDPGRRKFFQEQGFAAASKLSEGTHFSKLWIVGKYDLAVPRLIPQNATAVVFSVPHALGSRPDVRVVEAGTLHMDLSRLDRPRQFTNKLRVQEIFACHAASCVAAFRLKRDGLDRIVETGPVDPNTMDTWLEDAKQLGFQVPRVSPIPSTTIRRSHEPPIIIVGAGPSGLAVAASLARQNIPSLILESQEDPTQFGSWEHHFSGLEVTSQKKWCQLPGFGISDFPGDYISAQDYRRYLHLYAARFGLEIRRGVQVVSIEKGHDAQNPWTIQVVVDSSSLKTATLSASAVVVATGKHRVPQRNTSGHLAERLEQAKIPFCHTTDLRDEPTWSQAIQAAKKGRLAIVGFGNSAADIATAILQQCPPPSTGDHHAQIHIAARTVPPVFPRKASIWRVDTIGYWVTRRLLPQIPVLQDLFIRVLWWAIPTSRTCNESFPSHLKRWQKIHGRVPVIDKYGVIASGFQSGRLVGHGPVLEVIAAEEARTETAPEPATARSSSSSTMLSFDDYPHARNESTRMMMIPIDIVLFATGYQSDANTCDGTSGSKKPLREDRLNGLYVCGFGNDQFLPLQSIGEQAQSIAHQIAASDHQITTSCSQ